MRSGPSPKLFVSYARADREWLERFRPYLTPASRSGTLAVWWDDEGIPSGAEWGPAIERELAEATAALVLVSVNLLASDFIREKELPAILERRRARNLQLYWVPVSDVGAANLEILGLDGIQAAAPADPRQPLDAMEERDRRQVVSAICNRMLLDLKTGPAAHLSTERRHHLVSAALARLRSDLDLIPGDTIAYGDFAIVCRGRMHGREVAIKVLARSPFRERPAEFEERVRRARALEDACFLKLRHCALAEEPQLLVSDYTEAPTLAQHLAKAGKPFHPGAVARLIQRLALAMHEYHRCGLRYGTLSSHSVFYDEAASPRPMLRLHAIAIASHLSQADETESRFPRDTVEATYLTPEQYEGQPYTERSDQYGIGLLALEMLEGRPPVTVTRLADLQAKRHFYEDPGRFAGSWQRDHSRLRRVILRMLEREPSRRFDSLAEAHRALAHLEPADAVLAKKSYSRVCAGRSGFYAAFYQRFFRACPDAEAMFGDMNMEEQYAKLDAALHYLLNFADQDMTEPTALTGIARRHERLGLTRLHFEEFAAALLETLREFGEGEAVEAWERTIRPGVQYLVLRSSAARSGS